MSTGVYALGMVSTGQVGVAASVPAADNFRRATSGTAAGTAGIVVGTAGKPGRFYRGVFQNGGATAYYVQVFDKATAPVNADVPIYVKRLPASGECEIDLADVNGLPCALGIGIAISSTPGALTLAVTTDLAFRSVVYTQQS